MEVNRAVTSVSWFFKSTVNHFQNASDPVAVIVARANVVASILDGGIGLTGTSARASAGHTGTSLMIGGCTAPDGAEVVVHAVSRNGRSNRSRMGLPFERTADGHASRV